MSAELLASTYVLIDGGDVRAIVTVYGRDRDKRAALARRHFAQVRGVSTQRFAKSGADIQELAGAVPERMV